MRLEDIMAHFMYRAELCFQHCAETSFRVFQCQKKFLSLNTLLIATLTLLLLCQTLSHIIYLQTSRNIESITFVIDFEKLSLQKHLYWPGIQMTRQVYETTYNYMLHTQIIREVTCMKTSRILQGP